MSKRLFLQLYSCIVARHDACWFDLGITCSTQPAGSESAVKGADSWKCTEPVERARYIVSEIQYIVCRLGPDLVAALLDLDIVSESQWTVNISRFHAYARKNNMWIWPTDLDEYTTDEYRDIVRENRTHLQAFIILGELRYYGWNRYLRSYTQNRTA